MKTVLAMPGGGGVCENGLPVLVLPIVVYGGGGGGV